MPHLGAIFDIQTDPHLYLYPHARKNNETG